MKILAAINQKGGVGKTSTALAIGEGLLLKGMKVLFIDLDPQGNLSYTLGADPTRAGAMEVLAGENAAKDVIQHLERGDLISGDAGLSMADRTFNQGQDVIRLKEALAPFDSVYDYCIIDTPPALSILTVNALTAAYGVIIPAQAEVYSLSGIGQLYGTLSSVKNHSNPNLKILGIVISSFNPRAVVRRELAKSLNDAAAKMGTKVYKTRIRVCTALVEAQMMKKSIFEYAPKSNAAADYAALVDEVLEDLQHE